MFKLIAGKEGCGKTKRIIDLANDQLKNASGNIVYIDDNKHHMYDLKHDLRFISMDEIPVKTRDEFYGFICGMISNNYDIQTVYIDGIQKMTNMNIEETHDFIKKTDAFVSQHGIEFVYTLTCEDECLSSEFKANVI